MDGWMDGRKGVGVVMVLGRVGKDLMEVGSGDISHFVWFGLVRFLSRCFLFDLWSFFDCPVVRLKLK